MFGTAVTRLNLTCRWTCLTICTPIAELKDAIGRPLFETISISLVCADCMKTETPELCTHKLSEMPRWLSSAKMEVVKSLLAEDPVRGVYFLTSRNTR